MGKTGNKERRKEKREREKNAAMKVLAEADNSQEKLELERAYGETDDEDFLDDDLPQYLLPPPAADTSERFRVGLFQDHTLQYPELYLEVFVADSRYEEATFAEMFARAGCTRAKSLDEADICVFTGGPDVDPVLYGELPHPSTRINAARDTADLETYKFCLHRGIPMFGVCRGAQFLWAMNGNKLFQDVDGHHGEHQMLDIKQKTTISKVSSVHHQLCRPPAKGSDAIILATASKSRTRWFNAKESARGVNADIEAFWIPSTLCIGVQGHPEYSGYNQYTIWCLQQIENYIILNNDIDWVDAHRRLKPELLAERIGKESK
jgi:gamma-glutamyl-gamma-aminobutyrate hydrolase PuuD